MTLVRCTISVLYSLVGWSGCVAFFCLKNYPAAVMAIITGVVNGILSYIHFLNYKNKLQDWYNPQHLRQMGCFGFYTFAVATSVFIYFVVIEIMEKTPILPIQNSAVIAMVWCFIALKSGLLLLYFGRRYSRQEHTLLTDQRPQLESTSEAQEITA